MNRRYKMKMRMKWIHPRKQKNPKRRKKKAKTRLMKTIDIRSTKST
jgi:hypothetical protein